MTDKQPITEKDFRITYVKWGANHPVTEENLVEKSNLYFERVNLPKDEAKKLKQQILDGQKALKVLQDTKSQAFVNLAVANQKLNEEIYNELTRFNQFRVEINNLMMSLRIFDDDRHKRGEPMLHADAFARYQLIVEKFAKVDTNG